MAAPAGGLIVTYTLAGTATVNADYTNTQAGTVIIQEGQNSATVTLPVIDDNDIEGTETIDLTITSVTSPAIIGTANASKNLTDNDVLASPYISLFTNYAQDFNTLANTGTSATHPIGW